VKGRSVTAQFDDSKVDPRKEQRFMTPLRRYGGENEPQAFARSRATLIATVRHAERIHSLGIPFPSSH